MDTRFGVCTSGPNGLHQRKAIGYEKLAEGPRYESLPSGSFRISGQAHFRYWVVWVCDACGKTWWIEDHPAIDAEAAVRR